MSSEHWKIPEIEGIYTELVEDGELRESQVKIPNVSFDENVRIFRNWYDHKKEEYRYTDIVCGQDILSSGSREENYLYRACGP